MFNMGCRPIIIQSTLELTNSEIESADSSADSARIVVWVGALWV